MSRYSNRIMKNNVHATLSTSISSIATTIQLMTWQGARFWNDFPQIATLESVENWKVIKREIVQIVSRSGDNLTVERAFAPCPENDDANSQTQTSFSFNADDTISLYIPKEIFDKIHDSLNDIYDNWVNKLRTEVVSWLQIKVNAWPVLVWSWYYDFAWWTLTLTDNATNYVEIDNTGTLVANTSWRWTKSTKISKVITSWWEVVNIQDWRLWTVWWELWWGWNPMVDILIVWWWWGGGSWQNYNWWAWWWWWEVIILNNEIMTNNSISITVWNWWAWWSAWYSWSDWCPSCFWNYVANWWKWWSFWWWKDNWWNSWNWNPWWISGCAWWWWGWASWPWWSWDCYTWWAWWPWTTTNISWNNTTYWIWWGWSSYCFWWAWWPNCCWHWGGLNQQWIWRFWQPWINWWWGWWSWPSWWTNTQWWAWWNWVVIVRYRTDWLCNIWTATWWAIYCCWDYTIHCFTNNWTFEIIS